MPIVSPGSDSVAAVGDPREVPHRDEVCAVGRRAGLDVVGVAAAEVFTSTRADLEARREQGLHGGMAFTYRKPERSTDPSATLPGARSLVVGALAYRRAEPAPPPERATAGRVARYSWTDHYATLRSGLAAVATHLVDHGWRAVVVADDNALVDREAAYRAGIGWYGKNANLLLPGLGSWFVLGSVITDAPLVPSPGPVADGCGSCTRCIDSCPTGAIVAPGIVDARRCLAWLVQAPGTFPREHRVAMADRIYGCDDCQEVCPPNRLAERQDVGGATSVPDEGLEPWVQLLDLLTADDATLIERHGRWYIPRRDPQHLRRNALVALGNVADPHDRRVVEA
ncbi:MAG: tRNA epoxyqueuosine(34) reductase QueG, partial [Acidimicrobiia bacterium]|nr:tRNA epoxyqueuosine(34) reductase QueG [Acidimicrobiia bacterium]